jgi:hypothetical protein
MKKVVDTGVDCDMMFNMKGGGLDYKALMPNLMADLK